MAPEFRAAAISIVLAGAGACGGGGGGGGGGGAGLPPPNAAAFTSFDAVPSNQTAALDGIAVTGSGTQTVASDGDITVTSANVNAVGGGTVQLTFDDDRSLKAISINTPQSSVSFDRDSLACSRGLCGALNRDAAALAIDPIDIGWNYQSFGVWLGDLTSTTWSGGAISAGAPTPGSAIPLTGMATFNGRAGGFYLDTVGTPHLTEATMRAEVNFGTRNIAFSTSGTSLRNVNTGARSNNADLDLTGTFAYTQGINAFAGPLNAGAASGLNPGSASGRFYGPGAEEIGGVYSLQGTGVSRMVGGFGGRQ